ncbi:putative lyase [Streptomyces turgidiscabies]|nr:putative lyase [Streptomyces turgidiscabies]
MRVLLGEGADPDTVDADGGEGSDTDGLPVLCVAVAAYDHAVAEVLVEGGADPDRVLPDGTTPLWRAVDGGSPAVFTAVLGKEPRLRMPEEARERLLDLARGWYETGAVEELRRRAGTGSPVDAVDSVRVQDEEYEWVEQISLGGLVVRAGHGAVLTSLEWAFRVLTPVDELIGRAVDPPDEDHVNWSTGCWILAQRPSFETWSAVVAHRHDSDLVHRRFVVGYLRLRSIAYTSSPSGEKREADFLAAWAAEETDSGLLAEVLEVFAWYTHQDQETIGLRYADHPDLRVRREVPYTLSTHGVPLTTEARAALLTLTRDPDTRVRLAACEVGMRDDDRLPDITRTLLVLAEDPDPETRRAAAATLANSRIRRPAVSDALVALLAHDDQLVRLEGAYGLAVRDDPRTEEAIDRVGPLGPGFEDDHRASEFWRWRWRRENLTEA